MRPHVAPEVAVVRAAQRVARVANRHRRGGRQLQEVRIGRIGRREVRVGIAECIVVGRRAVGAVTVIFCLAIDQVVPNGRTPRLGGEVETERSSIARVFEDRVLVDERVAGAGIDENAVLVSPDEVIADDVSRADVHADARAIPARPKTVVVDLHPGKRIVAARRGASIGQIQVNAPALIVVIAAASKLVVVAVEVNRVTAVVVNVEVDEPVVAACSPNAAFLGVFDLQVLECGLADARTDVKCVAVV